MNIVITGASRGIGFETALKLCSEGHYVFAVSRNAVGLEKLLSVASRRGFAEKMVVMQADITKENDVKAMMKRIIALDKYIDVLVNNAGMLVNKNITNISDDEVKNIFDTNVFAPFRLIREMIPLMGKKSVAHIVNIGSMGGVQGSEKFAGLSAYSSSKGALSILTECLAVELKEKKIRVNCLAIGAVETEMLKEAFPGYQPPLSAVEMAEMIAWFAVNGQLFMNGRIIPVSLNSP